MPTDTVWIVITVPRTTLYSGGESTLKIRNDLKQLTAHAEFSKKTWEQVLEQCLKNLGVGDAAVWMPTKDQKRVQVYFSVELDDNDSTLLYLNSMGFGLRKGTEVGFIPFSLYFNEEDEIDDPDGDFSSFSIPGFHSTKKSPSAFKRAQDDFLKSVTSRLTVTQVIEGVKSSSVITFDYVMYTVFAVCLAAAGIMSSTPIDVAAAMCIEPVMATVVAASFGVVIHDWSLIKIGLRNNCFILIVCLVGGFLYALVAILWAPLWNNMWPTSEMASRGMLKSLWYGALQASAAGGALALGLLNNNSVAIVGVAIASTFMPPMTNTGILWAYTCHLSWRGMSEDYQTFNISGSLYRMKPAWAPMDGYVYTWYADMRWECMFMSFISAMYTYVNCVCLWFACTCVLKLKEVAPLGRLDPTKRFFQEDIRAYREYNQQQRKSMATGSDEPLGAQILREWAAVAGLDPKVLLSDRPEARITQLQTLRDMASDIENDQVYNSVTRGVQGRPDKNLFRRMTQSNIYTGRSGSNGHLRPDVDTYPGDAEMGVYCTHSLARRPSSTRLHPDDAIGGRGLRPREMESERRASIALKRQLKETPHSPYSVWPNSVVSEREPQHVTRFTVSEVRQRSNTDRRSSSAERPPDTYSTKF